MENIQEIQKDIERATKLLENANLKLEEELQKDKPVPLKGYKLKLSGVIEKGDFIYYDNKWNKAEWSIGDSVIQNFICTRINKSLEIPEGYYIEDNLDYIIQKEDMIGSETNIDDSIWNFAIFSIGLTIKKSREYYINSTIQVARPIKKVVSSEEMNRLIASYNGGWEKHNGQSYNNCWDMLISALKHLYKKHWKLYIYDTIEETYRTLYEDLLTKENK